MNSPPAIIGVLMTRVGSLLRSRLSASLRYSNEWWANQRLVRRSRDPYQPIRGQFYLRYSHLNTRFQSKPPRRSALAPMYAKLSMLMTSMMGHTTLVLSSTTRARRGSSQSLLHSQWESRKVKTPDLAHSNGSQKSKIMYKFLPGGLCSSNSTSHETFSPIISRFNHNVNRQCLVVMSFCLSWAHLSTTTFCICATSSPSLGSSLKSSTRMISLMRCSGLLLSTLTMVLSRVERASLWKVMMTEVGGRESAWPQVWARQALLLVSGTSRLLGILSLASCHGKDDSYPDDLYSFY